MALFVKIISFILLLSLCDIQCYAQEGGPPKQTFKSKFKQRREDRKKWKEERRNTRAEKKAVKAHHKRIQTKAVRKRMKQKRGVALRNHNNEKEPFFQRVFKRKGIRKGRLSKERSTKVKQ